MNARASDIHSSLEIQEARIYSIILERPQRIQGYGKIQGTKKVHRE
jgi:hypothetical protein